MKKKVLFDLIICILVSFGLKSHAQNTIFIDSTGLNSFTTAEAFYVKEDFEQALPYYKQAQKLGFQDSTEVFAKMAFCNASLNRPHKSSEYIKKYLKSNFDLNILKSAAFNEIRETVEFKNLEKKYSPRISISALSYSVISLLGFILSFILIFRTRNFKSPKRLIGLFVLLHSIFIVHVCLYLTNYRFEFPHILFASASFSYLYGPLVYFYFKRVTQNHEFHFTDLIHLIPFMLYILKTGPLYLSSSEEKLLYMLNFQQIKIYDFVIMTKVTSLIIYGFMVVRLYKENSFAIADRKTPSEYIKWQRAYIGLYVFYVLGYIFYVITVTVGGISQYVPIHIWLTSMSLSVLIVGYFAHVQPKVLDGSYTFKDTFFFKYKNSGLTADFSVELKTELESLMVHQKLYSDQTISLDSIAKKLGTTRHNTSQVINEHFNMNFFEFVNHYRIEEAKNMLLEKDEENDWNWDIIDVLFHVGFNNRITFNKVFKKITSTTPTQFRQRFKKMNIL